MASQVNLAGLLDRLEQRGGMYVQPFNYQTLTAFISGYDLGLVDAGAPSEIGEFQLWLDRRVGHHCSMNWPAVVRDVFAGGDEDKAVPALFGLLRSFYERQKEEGENRE